MAIGASPYKAVVTETRRFALLEVEGVLPAHRFHHLIRYGDESLSVLGLRRSEHEGILDDFEIRTAVQVEGLGRAVNPVRLLTHRLAIAYPDGARHLPDDLEIGNIRIQVNGLPAQTNCFPLPDAGHERGEPS